jgi:acetyl esterase
MADYARLIDAETRAFIRATEAAYPPDTATATIPRQREIYNAFCRVFDAGRPAVLAVADRPVAGVPCRHYGTGGAARVVYLHGGGFVVGGLDSHDDVCAEIAAATGFRLTAVDYRLSPEHRHPAAFEDACAVVRAVAAEALPVVLAGDSAGGNLAAAAAHALRGEGLPIAGMVLVYPGLGGPADRGSMVTHAMAPMLTAADVAYYHGIRAAAGHDLSRDPTAFPLADTDYAGLPPALIVTAECDPLSDDGRDYRDRIVAAGGRAVWVEEKGLVHGYLRARHSVARARDSFARIVAGIAALGRGEGLEG